MKHKISVAPLNGPLPIPHFLQWPPFSKKNIFDLIVPSGFELNTEDTISGLGSEKTVIKIVERRPAKGDWSKQKTYKNPDFVRIIAQ